MTEGLPQALGGAKAGRCQQGPPALPGGGDGPAPQAAEHLVLQAVAAGRDGSRHQAVGGQRPAGSR